MMREKCVTCGMLLLYHKDECSPDDVRRHKTNIRRRAARKAKDDLMSGLGMTRVRGNLGGTYYE